MDRRRKKKKYKRGDKKRIEKSGQGGKRREGVRRKR